MYNVCAFSFDQISDQHKQRLHLILYGRLVVAAVVVFHCERYAKKKINRSLLRDTGLFKLPHFGFNYLLSNQLPSGPSGTSSVGDQHCPTTETHVLQTCHAPREPLQNHASGNLGKRATPRSAEKLFDGQEESGRPNPRQNCSRRPLVEKNGRGSLLNRPS